MRDLLSVNGYSFGASPLADDVAAVAALGIGRMVIPVNKLPADSALPDLGGVEVAALLHPGWFTLDEPERWPSERAALTRTVELADAVGTTTIYGTTGRKGALDFAAASARFRDALAPVKATADAAGIALTIETTNTLFADLSFVHTLADTVDVAEANDLAVCVDLFVSWAERDVDAALRRAVPRTPLVQVSDHRYGARGYPGRSVPGDGDIPLAHLLTLVLESGFAGVFDLELVGPAIDAEGAPAALERAAKWMDEFLTTPRSL